MSGDPRGHQGAAISGSSYIYHWKYYTATLTPVSVATIVVAEQTFVMAGLEVGDVVVGGGPQYDLTTAVGISGMRVSAADTLAVRFNNPTAGALVPAAGEWKIKVERFKDL